MDPFQINSIQQSVEKGLKAMILERGGRPGRVHDVVELLNEAQRLGCAVSLSVDDAVFLNSIYKGRYPCAVSLSVDDAVFLNSIYKGRYPTEEGLLPHGEPTGADAKRAAAAAEGFMKDVRRALK